MSSFSQSSQKWSRSLFCQRSFLCLRALLRRQSEPCWYSAHAPTHAVWFLLPLMTIRGAGYLKLSHYEFGPAEAILKRELVFTHLLGWKTCCLSSSKGEHAFTATLVSSSLFINILELEWKNKCHSCGKWMFAVNITMSDGSSVCSQEPGAAREAADVLNFTSIFFCWSLGR